MGGILLLIAIVVAVAVYPDLRSNPMALIFAGICLLAIIGLAYGKYLEVGSSSAMIDRRNRR